VGARSLFGEHLRRHWVQYGFGAILLSISSLLQLLIPQLLKDFTDRLQEFRLTPRDVLALALGIALIALGAAAFRSVSRIYLYRLARVMDKQLRQRLFIRWESLSAEYYNRRRIGDLMAHATNDVNVVREVAMQGVFLSVEAVVLVAVAVAAMAGTVHAGLTLLVLVPLPALTYLAYRFRTEIHQRSTRVQEAIGELTSRVQEFCAGIRVIKAYVQEREEMRKFGEANLSNLEMNRQLIRANASFTAWSQTVVGISYLMSVAAGGLMVLRGTISLGEFVAFNTYLTMLISPVENLGRVINVLQRGRAADARLRQVLDTQPEVYDEEDAVLLTDIRGRIEIRNLTFTYPNRSRPTLENINLTIPAGTSLAIVGKVGSGKTTLVNLLLRLYNPPYGTIFIDGVDIRKIRLEQLRRAVGYVPQENFLFSTTIRENIAFDPRDYGSEDIEEAARIAQVHDNIVAFPRRFDTPLGERGISLSGGQRQRVSMARALIKKPAILIFDDSLSAVDAETEERILQGLERVMKGRTTIITSHRLSAIRHADRIIVLDQGRIVEQGDHRSLLKLGGIYASIYEQQTMNRVMAE
jgi:ATP-binding cassette subfamily B protein